MILGIFPGSCQNGIIVGAEQPEKYFSQISGKKLGLVVNQTSMVKDIHLVDFLIENGMSIEKIFAPEHGFRGEAARGEEIADDTDFKTGIPVISLYGENRKPERQQLNNIDFMVFDIQDVGCRFYTYISTLHLVLEACAENNIPLLVFDRPNPNGDYISGPLLKKTFSSFVGMDPIPVVHGCTIGEMARMINGEHWHAAKNKCNLTVIPVENYTHNIHYSLPVKPSPNLPNDFSVRLYPSLCFFEATNMSIGRGTDFPFQVIGYPDPAFGSFTFKPVSIPGVAVNPIQEGNVCYGEDLRDQEDMPKFTLSYFLKYYRIFENESDFLSSETWFNLLAGTDEVLKLIRQGKSLDEIEISWNEDLKVYKKIRKKYLLYTDFE